MFGLSPQELLSFAGLLTGCGVVIIWLLRDRKELIKALEDERKYGRELTDKFQSAALQFATTLQANTSSSESLKYSVDEVRRVIDGCKGSNQNND